MDIDKLNETTMQWLKDKPRPLPLFILDIVRDEKLWDAWMEAQSKVLRDREDFIYGK